MFAELQSFCPIPTQLLLVGLEALDWSACKYLEVTAVDLDLPSLFQGFSTEEELVDFATRGEAGVSVLAGSTFLVKCQQEALHFTNCGCDVYWLRH